MADPLVVLELDGVRPMTANDARKMNAWAHRKAADVLKQQLTMALRQTVGPTPPRFDEPVTARLEVRPPDRTHRDVDGWYPTLKYSLDTAVAAAVIPEDCTCWVTDATCAALPPARPWMFRLVLTPTRLAATHRWGVSA